MALNEAQFSRKTESEIKNYDVLKSVFTKIYETENDLQGKRKSAFDEITKISEDNEALRGIYGEFTTEMKALEEFRNNQMIKIKSKLIPATIYYSSRAKTYKQQIGKYKDTKKKTEKQEQEMAKVQASQNNVKASQLKADINTNKSIIHDVGKNLQDQIMDFEAKRINDNKLIILHFIHCELAYHAKSLEKLSLLYKQVQNLKPKRHLKEFADKYNFQNVNLEDYGYDEREFLRNASVNQSQSRMKQSSISQSRGMLKNSLKVSGIGESKRMRDSQFSDELEKITENNNENNSEL